MRSRIRSVLGWAAVGLAVGLALAAWDALAATAPPRPDARVAGLDAAVDAGTAARPRELGHLR